MTFHGKNNIEPSLQNHVKESPWVVLIPLIALAIPSIIAGGMLIGPMLFHSPRLLGNSIVVLMKHDVLLEMAQTYQGAQIMALNAVHHSTFWLAMAGIITAWLFNLEFLQLGSYFKKRFSFLYSVMVNKYGFDDFNQIVFVRGTRRLGEFFYHVTDLKVIDGLIVNGSGKFIRWTANVSRRMQTGFIYHYALSMVIGLAVFLVWFLLGN